MGYAQQSIAKRPIETRGIRIKSTLMSRPPQNLCLIDHALSECKQILDWYQFLARERRKERLSPIPYKGIHYKGIH